MKKFVWILLALCLVLGCVVGYVAAQGAAKDEGEPVALYDPENVAAAEETPAAEPAPADGEQTPAAEAEPVRYLDYEKIYALHAPEEIVGSVDGRELSWDEYFYWLHDMGTQAESYIRSLAMYGQSLSWTDKLSSDSEQTLAEYVLELTGETTRQLAVIEAVAGENDVTLTAENEAAIAAQLQQTIVNACGEGATEEDFNALLEENFISRAMYDRIDRANYLFQNTFTALYGEDGAAVSEADALAYLEENEYIGAAHILFMTIDPETYEPLDDSAIDEKLALAEAVSAELRAIEDTDARVKRFAELKEQYCEDSGKTAYPDGYLFTPGTMVSEFEDGTLALGEYAVSEPILSAYGYHVIMRLPLSAEMTVEFTDAGTPLTARSLCADAQFDARMTARFEQSVLTLNDEVAALDLTEYLTEGE